MEALYDFIIFLPIFDVVFWIKMYTKSDLRKRILYRMKRTLNDTYRVYADK